MTVNAVNKSAQMTFPGTTSADDIIKVGTSYNITWSYTSGTFTNPRLRLQKDTNYVSAGHGNESWSTIWSDGTIASGATSYTFVLPNDVALQDTESENHGRYRFVIDDETADDETIGTSFNFVIDKGKALSVNGDNNYAWINEDLFENISGDISFTFIAKPNQTRSNLDHSGIMVKSTTSPGFVLMTEEDDDTPDQVTFNTRQGNHQKVLGDLDLDGEYHNYTCVFDQGSSTTTMTLYIDGVQVSTKTYNGGIGSISGTEGLYIGGDAGVGQDFFGEISSVSIWNKALTASEIAADLYGEWIGNETSLIAAWNFESGLLDATSNDSDLTMVGSATYTDIP